MNKRGNDSKEKENKIIVRIKKYIYLEDALNMSITIIAPDVSSYSFYL